MRRSKLDVLETASIASSLYSEFATQCWLRDGHFEISKFLKNKGLREPFATVFTRLQADELFLNVGSKKLPCYKGFKHICIDDVLKCLSWYQNQSHSRYELHKERQRKMWEFIPPVRRKFTVKVFGFTLFSI